MGRESKVVDLEKVVIKFAGDSGDGMQLTGAQFTDTSALLGNDLATFPDFPAEIRAPQGTVAGVMPGAPTTIIRGPPPPYPGPGLAPNASPLSAGGPSSIQTSKVRNVKIMDL